MNKSHQQWNINTCHVWYWLIMANHQQQRDIQTDISYMDSFGSFQYLLGIWSPFKASSLESMSSRIFNSFQSTAGEPTYSSSGWFDLRPLITSRAHYEFHACGHSLVVVECIQQLWCWFSTGYSCCCFWIEVTPSLHHWCYQPVWTIVLADYGPLSTNIMYPIDSHCINKHQPIVVDHLLSPCDRISWFCHRLWSRNNH